ncbi:hypothetical protein [Rhizobium tumorigenes]|uniref:Uncharacterized protein n=1 Tax=Rhizobium tumorigenes TaxID=2041385 RepID=A0AAF1K5S1_9HYPH|nr:hypothetical protein [Rhizobium tumorigenes]WFR96532.1 hypothetical protein PR017_05225 [Rhizobium tumorigenes]
MTAKPAKAALFLISMVFFAVLALNMAVPAVILGSLALVSELVLTSGNGIAYRGEAA